MPWINLIEEQRSAVRQLARKARCYFLVFVGTTALAVAGFGFLWYETDNARRLEKKLAKQIARIEPLLKRIDEQQAEMSAMGPRLTSLEGAQQDTQRWKRILEHLATNTPNDIWLVNLRCSGGNDGKPLMMELRGMGAKLESIGQFLLRLEACPDFKSVNLKQSTERAQGSMTAIEFTSEITVDGMVDEKPKDTTKAKKGQGA